MKKVSTRKTENYYIFLKNVSSFSYSQRQIIAYRNFMNWHNETLTAENGNSFKFESTNKFGVLAIFQIKYNFAKKIYES